MKRLPLGLHLDVLASDYHSDCAETPSLSSGLAKVLLEATPKHAWLKHPRLNPHFEHGYDDKFDLGSVVHELILGRGGGIEILPAEFTDYRKKDAQQMKADARAAGLTPILAHQYAEAQEIAHQASHALKEIPDCESFFHPSAVSEAVIIWQDAGGPVCRAMIDRLSGFEAWDIKTTSAGLSDAAISRTIVNLGYDVSAAFYLRGLAALKGVAFNFRWVFVETDPPYEVRVVEADATTLAIGARKAALAIEKWRKALEHNLWVGYPRHITRSFYPVWAEEQWLQNECDDADFANVVLSDRVRNV